MGKDARENKELQEVGRYNVLVTLYFQENQTMMQEALNCKTWMHAGPFLALTLFDGTLRVICLNQYHGFTVNALKPETLENLN